ncbi:ABC transporter permease [Natronoflexus pectinivorans]|uniref:ABC-2 type transport system permease protein n=1 Tax=Natronoflexus pectinivorans TaxID=682526 RepID=A0A4V2RWS8_9BACT|nr:ABC transporter permease [Natronoflexus pectinivorans]TCO09841.1 ABC-2 type transport system permease protein [Natronoflexus pectinivorans]
MNYWIQLKTVMLWEYHRFFKIKNELIGIVIMLVFFVIGFFGSSYAFKASQDKSPIFVANDVDGELIELLSENFDVTISDYQEQETFIAELPERKSGLLLTQEGATFEVHSWRNSGRIKELQRYLDEYRSRQAMQEIDLPRESLQYVLKPANVNEVYYFTAGSRERRIMAIFFSGMMVMAVFISFAYQFTAITGEKQLRITEQIVSAIRPQVWMDGKILGITLTGFSSILIYTIISILGGIIYFQITGSPLSSVLAYLHVPSILLFLSFTVVGVLLWNSVLAAIASIITDPNNSVKSSLMILPSLFVGASFLLLLNPDNHVAVFLSWFPLFSASAMPMRFVVTDVAWWEILGSFILLALAFYYIRKLAARIFHVSILINGNEPTWKDVFRMLKESK